MPQLPNEDLFESTKMTFGEHLEELRICLVKALSGLAIGFFVGLAFAGPVVRQIEGPLKRALEKFHFEKTKGILESQYGVLPEEVVNFMRERGFVFEDMYWEVDELNRVLADVQAAKEAGPASDWKPTPAGMANASESASDADNEMDEESNAPPRRDVVIISEPTAPTARMIKTRLWRPLDADVTSLSAHEPFMIWIKAALITGAILSSPWIFLQIWNFVAAGLYPHEKSYVYFFLPFSLGLFFAGAALAFFFVFDPVLDFLFQFNQLMNIDPDPRISEWMSFVLFLPLGFGISFQLPLVMLILERIGIFSIHAYIDKWRIAVLAIFVLSMFLTPADPISMLLMACPLTVLYFGGVLLCKYLPKRQSPFGEGFDP